MVYNGRKWADRKTTIDVSENGMIIENSHNIMITDNTINAKLVNIGLESENDMNISRNTFITTYEVIIGGDNNYIFSYNTLIMGGNGIGIRGNCILYRNNFMTKPQPIIFTIFFDIYVPLSSHVKFLQNYWWKPRLFPKLILGIIYKPGIDHPEFELPWFFIDWHPAKEPYDISQFV
jgi:hypothetical protein